MTTASVRTKLFLIASSFTLPLGVLLYLTVANINSGIHFANKELAGAAYLKPLAAMLENVQEHELAVLSGSDCGAISSKAETALKGLRAENAKFEQLLEFDRAGLAKRNREHLTVAAVAGQWREIAAAGCGGAPEKYAKLTGDLRGMIAHAGDTSNLILDPDLDSYYLMDAVVIALPQTQSRQWKVLRESRQPDEAWRKRAVVDAAMLKEADLDRIDVSVVTSINEDAGFYGTSPSLRTILAPALEAYKGSAGRFVELTGKGLAGESPGEFHAAGFAAMRASFSIWRSATNELELLLQARISDARNYRFWALMLAGFAVAGACILSWYFMRSIVSPLEGLIRSLGPGAVLLSECVGRIAETSKTTLSGSQEAEIICEELNAHADDMRKAVYQLALHVSGAAASDTVRSSDAVPAEDRHA